MAVDKIFFLLVKFNRLPHLLLNKAAFSLMILLLKIGEAAAVIRLIAGVCCADS
jgi:hypothetical protein